MDPNKSFRVLADQSFEIRKADEGGGRTVVGYAAVFEVETDIGGYFREKIAKGAFTEALKTSDVHALYNHDYNRVLGRAKSGTLRMKEDDHGLKVEIDLPDTQEANDLAVKMERGDIDQMSFQFSMRDGKSTWDETGDEDLRIIEQVGELFDVSICPRGAYDQTECGLRTFEARQENLNKRRNFSAAQRRRRMKAKYYARRMGEGSKA